MIEPQTIRKRFEIAMQLVLSKDSRDLLENFRDSLIEHALYLNEPADAFKIKSIIESEMKLSCFTEHEIEQRLSRLNQESKIQDAYRVNSQ